MWSLRVGLALLWAAATSTATELKFDFANAVELKLINAYGESRDRFGTSVSLNNIFTVVGSSDSSPKGQEAGSAYVFTNISTNSSNIPQELSPAKLVPRQGFGTSTALWGNTIAIGAPKYNLFTGAVYIYRYTGLEWSETQIVQAGDGTRGDYYGISVSLSSRFLVVGANSKDELKGSVYVLAATQNGFVEKQMLQPFDTHEYQKFGHAVAIADAFIAVGAIGDNTKSQYSHGAVYLYEMAFWQMETETSQNNWTKLTKLYANIPKDLSNYGVSVAIARHVSHLTEPFLYTLIIGADNDDAPGVSGAGSVYVYLVKSGSVTYITKLYASVPQQDSQFGFSLSINSGHFLIGAPGYGSREGGPEFGAAYLFEAGYAGSKWYFKKMFVANDTRPYSRFGIAVAVYEGKALLGADQGSGVTPNSGSAYLFSPEFAKKEKGKANLFWSTNPEEDILVILTILPFAVLLIPLLVLSCVYGMNYQWVYIEVFVEGISKLLKGGDPDADDFESGSQSTRGLIGESSHSAMDSSQV